jgi:hypothetical protein
MRAHAHTHFTFLPACLPSSSSKIPFDPSPFVLLRHRVEETQGDEIVSNEFGVDDAKAPATYDDALLARSDELLRLSTEFLALVQMDNSTAFPSIKPPVPPPPPKSNLELVRSTVGGGINDAKKDGHEACEEDVVVQPRGEIPGGINNSERSDDEKGDSDGSGDNDGGVGHGVDNGDNIDKNSADSGSSEGGDSGDDSGSGDADEGTMQHTPEIDIEDKPTTLKTLPQMEVPELSPNTRYALTDRYDGDKAGQTLTGAEMENQNGQLQIRSDRSGVECGDGDCHTTSGEHNCPPALGSGGALDPPRPLSHSLGKRKYRGS